MVAGSEGREEQREAGSEGREQLIREWSEESVA